MVGPRNSAQKWEEFWHSFKCGYSPCACTTGHLRNSEKLGNSNPSPKGEKGGMGQRGQSFRRERGGGNSYRVFFIYTTVHLQPLYPPKNYSQECGQSLAEFPGLFDSPRRSHSEAPATLTKPLHCARLFLS